MGSYIDPHQRQEWIQSMRSNHRLFDEFYRRETALWNAFEHVAEEIKPYVCDADLRLRQAIHAGKKVLMEGAQGTLLDLDHGTYPFVTSSSTTSGGACASIGFSPKAVEKIIGVSKAYVTRVGSGPFPSELNDDVGEWLTHKGQEFGATTGRRRRCGWLDAVALRYASMLNGFDGIILNKMDILTGLKEIKIAVAYEHPKLGRLEHFPSDAATVEQCKPIYKTFRGWDEAIPESGKIRDLPKAAREYVDAVEEATQTPVLMVGSGVGRHNALFR